MRYVGLSSRQTAKHENLRQLHTKTIFLLSMGIQKSIKTGPETIFWSLQTTSTFWYDLDRTWERERGSKIVLKIAKTVNWPLRMAKSAENMPSKNIPTDSDGPPDAREADRKVSTSLWKRFQLQFCRFFGSVATFVFRISGLPKPRLDMSKVFPHLLLKGAFHFTSNVTQYEGAHFSDELFAHLCILLQIWDRLPRFTQRLRLQQNARTSSQIYKMRGRRCSRRMAHSDIVGEGGIPFAPWFLCNLCKQPLLAAQWTCCA